MAVPDDLLHAVMTALEKEEELRVSVLPDGEERTRRRVRILRVARHAIASWSEGRISAESAASALEQFVSDPTTDPFETGDR